MKTFNYNFDTILDRAGTGTLKYDTCRELFGNPDVIPMWIADMDFECSPLIGEAICRRAAHNLYGYDIGGEQCIPSVTHWLARRAGWEVEAERFRFTTGVVAGLGFAIRAFSSPGDGVVIQPPVYPPFRAVIEGNGRQVVTNPLKMTDEGFEMDFEDLDRKLAEAKLMILCNPHNPVGRVFTEDELRRVGEMCCRHGVTILSDEIHSDLVFAPHRHIHIASLDGRFADRCVTFIAPSKTFNIAGLSTSVAILGCEEMRLAWDKEYASAHIPTGTTFGHVALRTAYDRCEDWLDEVLVYLKGNIDRAREFIADNIPQIKVRRQEGTYLIWLDFRELGFRTHNELMDWLVNKAGLGLNSGADFGREGIGFARLNAATNRATLERAMRQLAEAVSKIP